MCKFFDYMEFRCTIIELVWLNPMITAIQIEGNMLKVEWLKKNKTFILLFFIIVFSLLLRCININNPYGLWFDELFALDVSNHSFPVGIVKYLSLCEVHVPFYFLILHLWTNLFGDSDIVLRLFSVIFGALNVLAIYFVGKELDSEKLGLLAAFLVGINSFLIYFSQEVKFYSLVALLASLSILYMLKFIKKPNRITLAILMLINILIIFTFTIGIAFVGLEVLIFGIYFYLNNKPALKNFLLSQTILPLILLLLYSPILIIQFKRYEHIDKHFATFAWSNLYLYLQNLFSPVIMGLRTNHFCFLDQSNIGFLFYIFTIIPISIALVGLAAVLRKKHNVQWLFWIVFSFLSFELIATLTGKLSLLSRYTVIIAPLMILIMAYGLLSIKNRLVSKFLIGLFIFINLFFMFFYPNSVLRMSRVDGYNAPISALSQFKLSPKDRVIIYVGPEFFKRYYQPQYGQIINFSAHRIDYNSYFTTLKKYTLAREPYPSINTLITSNVINKLEKGRYFTIIRHKWEFSKNESKLFTIAGDDKRFKKESMYDMVGSKILNDMEKIASEHYELVSTIYSCDWVIKVYQNN